ncbi:MAG TPA: hypothetical protein VL463_12775 [Kofleriaceae bacterium]|nr:hypothetical protein [Kofleriaceae bacterium]
MTWLRYGHAKPARGDAADPLLDQFMRELDVCERHSIEVDAPPAVTMAAAQKVSLYDSRIVRAIFRARELILRAEPDPRSRRGLLEELKAVGWGVLAEIPGRELVLGAFTKPWQANPVFHAIAAGEFAAFAEPDNVKITVTLRVDPRADGGSIFRTETRAIATDPAARRKFRLYWSLLSPGIILIRMALMPLVRAAAERAWRIEGDDVVEDPRAQLTHATIIDAPPRDVWPWLLQMGCQRAGWYSWDLLDNHGKPSADHIIPELQHLAIGDVLPARPTGAEGFEVIRIVPERALVLRGVSPAWTGTWSFVLVPIGSGQTRLVTRYRAAYPPSTKMAVMLPVIATAHAIMEKKQLRTIKHHAEHMHGAPRVTPAA